MKSAQTLGRLPESFEGTPSPPESRWRRPGGRSPSPRSSIGPRACSGVQGGDGAEVGRECRAVRWDRSRRDAFRVRRRGRGWRSRTKGTADGTPGAGARGGAARASGPASSSHRDLDRPQRVSSFPAGRSAGRSLTSRPGPFHGAAKMTKRTVRHIRHDVDGSVVSAEAAQLRRGGDIPDPDCRVEARPPVAAARRQPSAMRREAQAVGAYHITDQLCDLLARGHLQDVDRRSRLVPLGRAPPRVPVATYRPVRERGRRMYSGWILSPDGPSDFLTRRPCPRPARRPPPR